MYKQCIDSCTVYCDIWLLSSVFSCADYVSMLNADLAPAPVPTKLCGHECERGGETQCCLCRREEQSQGDVGRDFNNVDAITEDCCPLCTR